MLSIKIASADDINDIISLNFKIWPQTYSHILQEDQIAYMLQLMYSPEALKKQMDSGHTFIICTDEQEEQVGFASFSKIEDDVYKLHKIYILPGKQGLGIGQFMLHYITESLQEKYAKFLELNVNIRNQQAQHFYKKTGFILYREEDIDIGNGYYMNDYVLRKPLS